MRGLMLDGTNSKLYAAYRTEVRTNRTLGPLRSGIKIVAGLYTPFLLLDYLVYDEVFWVLAATRASLVVVLAVCYRLAPTAPGAVMNCAVLATGFNLIAVIGIAGGVSSLYFPGLMLLFLGMPVILPVTARQSIWIVLALFGVFASLPIFGAGAFGTREYFVNLFFPGAAAAESIFSCALLSRLRFVDYCRTEEIAAARDELAKLDDAKTRFSANVHHELRTPLTLLLAPLDGLHDGEYGRLDEKTQKIVRTMRANGERLLKLINNLLDLAKLEDSKFSISRQSLSMTDLLNELADGTRTVAERKGISIDISGLPELMSVFADRDAFDKVFMNLLGNALKFTEAGGSIAIEGENVEGAVLVRIVDSGIGLEPGQLNRIFDRFAQVDTSTTRRHEGTGIGLSLAAELTALHGGRIWAESGGVGQGATMSVLIPVGESDAPDESVLIEESNRPPPIAPTNIGPSIEPNYDSTKTANQSKRLTSQFDDMDFEARRWADQSKTGEESTSGATGRSDDRPPILVVDDNADMRELLCHILEKRFRTRRARNGRDALDILKTFEPLLVVTDIMMPEVSGTELCAKIKSSSHLKEIPVMIISSKAEREMKVKGLELGADDYVTKPFHSREVLARATSLVNLHSAQKEVRIRNTELQSALDELRDAQARLVQSERLAAVGEIAAGIAHEVNNPVNFALNAARALRRPSLELQELVDGVAALDWTDSTTFPKQGKILQDRIRELEADGVADTVSELISIIEQGLDRTRHLVGDLRDFASATRSFQYQEFDLRESVSDTAGLCGHELSRADITLEISLPDDPCVVRGDKGAIAQIILNLLMNAAQALGNWESKPEALRPSIQITVGCSGSNAVVDITDNGPGIPAHNLPRLFEPFFTTKQVGDGTGLGLSVCRGIVDAHDGRIEVESELGFGSAFRIVLPCSAQTLATPAEQSDTGV